MPPSQLPSNIKIHFIKSSLFRVVRADGVIGGVTPSREIYMSVFNQRAAMPKVIEYSVTPEGRLGNEIAREGKEGIVREMEVGVLINAAAAKELAEFLLNQVKLLEESQQESQPHSKDESLSARKE